MRQVGRFLGALALVFLPLGAFAQNVPPADEEIEPKVVGGPGVMFVGFGGYLDKISSSEETLPTNFTIHVDVGRFLSARLLARGGLAGSGSVGGEVEDVPVGPGAHAVHAFAGALYYFTPGSI